MDELPYFLAPEVQLSFAVTNEVNFLASGRHAPERMGNFGIYILKFTFTQFFGLNDQAIIA